MKRSSNMLLCFLLLIIISHTGGSNHCYERDRPGIYIVSLNRYVSRQTASEIPKEMLVSSKWKELSRQIPNVEFENVPTDFLVLEFQEDEETQVKSILSHDLVKSVSLESRYERRKILQHIEKKTFFSARNLQYGSNSRLRGQGISASKKIGADRLWRRNITGRGVKVAVFDTGIREHHPHIRNLVERSVWTDETSADDGVGHGSFVAGSIAGHDTNCPGMAPDALIYAFKVFTDQQVSYTSWFLDAFNYAIFLGVDILNLSIGGPDYLDKPFVEKIRELISNNIVIVSAVGNSGPHYGTLMNPADDPAVIGVGGITKSHDIARFSSRGMTTWEIHDGLGYGRVKPDVMMYSENLVGSAIMTGCRRLSGTSVASPIIAGAAALLISALPSSRRHSYSSILVKQVLIDSSQRLKGSNIFESGAGLPDLEDALDMLLLSHKQGVITTYPESLNFSLKDCPYFWPYCRQPIYKGAMPVVANVTVLNSANSMGHIKSSPIWIPDSDNKYDDVLDIQTKYSSIIWPWGGHVSIFIRVRDSFTSSSSSIFVVSGSIVFSVSSRSNSNDDEETIITVRIPLRISVMPKVPPRYRRLLFDVSHSIQYPPGHIPRDDLSEEDDVLDWRGDHPHTNFRNIFDTLLSAGFFVEILYGDWTCFDANQYGAMFLIDSEDMNSRRERRKLQCDVSSHGLGLVVVGEWYNEKAQADAAFYDDNTKRWWEASTSGANVPALNCLLAPFEMAFSNRIYSGKFHVGTKNVPYASGTTIARFPKGGRLLFVDTLVDETEGVRNIGVLDRLRSSSKTSVPVLGLLSSEEEEEESAKSTRGNIALFGDSQCLDTVGSGKSCEWLVRLFARFAARVPRDELVSYSNVDTDMETQTQLSNALTEKFDALYTNGLDVPMRLSPEHHSRLAKVSTIQSWNPNENEIHFWDCDVSVQCTVPFSRNGVCT